MKKLPVALALILTFLPALSGCGRMRYPAYYTLNLPAPPDPPAPENVRTSIAVREFQSPGYLRQGPIVYRTTPEEIGFYEYHRWAADPRTLLTGAVIDHLRASGAGTVARSLLMARSTVRFISETTPRTFR